MPLQTAVQRDGEDRILQWDYFTLSCMLTVAVKEAEPTREFAEGRTFGELNDGEYVDFSWAPIYYLDWNVPILQKGRQVVKNKHTFKRDDEYELVFEPGDVLIAYRSHK